jgi:hypothetical protein
VPVALDQVEPLLVEYRYWYSVRLLGDVGTSQFKTTAEGDENVAATLRGAEGGCGA